MAIHCEGGDVQRMLFDPEERKKKPATAIDAKFSIPFTVALALVRGDVTLDDFDDSARGDPSLLAIADKVTYRQRPDWGRDRAASAAVELVLSDGRSLAREVEVPLGHPDRPLSDARLRAKFVHCAARSARPLDSAAAEALADRIFNLETSEDAGGLLRDLDVSA
jgi:2-methylcitrate dehydratase PrpD